MRGREERGEGEDEEAEKWVEEVEEVETRISIYGVIHLELVTYLAVHFDLSHCSVISCTYTVQLCAV